MTREQFDTAVELLQQDVWPDSQPDPVVLVFIAVCRIIARRHGISEFYCDYFSPDLRAQTREFLAALSAVKREDLKLVAEKVTLVEKTALH